MINHECIAASLGWWLIAKPTGGGRARRCAHLWESDVFSIRWDSCLFPPDGDTVFRGPFRSFDAAKDDALAEVAKWSR